MLDQVKLNQLNQLLNLALKPENANVFWKGLTKKPLSIGFSNLPKHVEEMQKTLLLASKDNAYFTNASFYLPFLKSIGQIAKKCTDEESISDSSVGKILQQLKDHRQPFTYRFYQILSPLAELHNKSVAEQNRLIDQICAQLIGLYSDNPNVQSLPNTKIIQQRVAEKELRDSLDIKDNSKSLIYLYTNDPPELVFSQGIRAPGKKLALKGQGSALDINPENNQSRYLITWHHLNLTQAKKYKYVYALDIPKAMRIPADEFHLGKIPDSSLIAQAIEGRQVVGSFTLEESQNRLQCKNIKKNPHYASEITFSNSSKTRPHLLFRGDSRHFSGNPKKNTVRQFEGTHAELVIKKPSENLFEVGFTALVNFNDDAEKYVNSRQPTIFISTSDNLTSCLKFPEESTGQDMRYVYVIYLPDSAINAQELTQSDHAKTDQEYLVPNHIPPGHIIGMCTITNGKLERFDFNDNTKVCIDRATFVQQFIEPALRTQKETLNATRNEENSRGYGKNEDDISDTDIFGISSSSYTDH
ncbi:hypothetical protein [Legionella jamestowniensis]|uniref:Uncharacterized protein n=1 Tax=Legionella jamestowniensis TaxID=455 RepID=A0A0W0UHS6_9GAMM|nr:hypothetical protein [Legionella jamestowniensis]KTD07442.1 hypothetical protein Ljam_1637 [Legionella jamestowniensis]SFL92803.1 hypothetical protein SAMN02746073_2573 [Legionella jamestowniensis DSM 19215]